MAAIDKMYVNSYYDYDSIRRWAMIYYPKLLYFFYDITLDYNKWSKLVDRYVVNSMEIAKRDYEKIGEYESKESAVKNLQVYYKKSANYDCPDNQAIEEVNDIIIRRFSDKEDWENKFTFPIMNTPISIDKKLLWICPVPCVRHYLEKICGYKTKWYHRLFWKGKLMF